MRETTAVEELQNQLLLRVAARDRAALGEFYDNTSTPLYSVALRILGDASEAEEVIQDVFVQIWEKAGAFDVTLGSAFHWALSITRHRSIDRVRARQRRARLVEEFQQAFLVEDPVQKGADAGALEADEAAVVRQALKGLPQEQREAITLAFFGGRTHSEIAESLKAPLGTVKARIRRGLLQLRENLQKRA